MSRNRSASNSSKDTDKSSRCHVFSVLSHAYKKAVDANACNLEDPFQNDCILFDQGNDKQVKRGENMPLLLFHNGLRIVKQGRHFKMQVPSQTWESCSAL
ncbi:hypothetical protein VTL71DRAFT_305 [Oculimacula yallundae]|uniref:Uncharacterized protein n=1 Tax=Oculimacula yallundae TaxID=86028 RepID=A0ABR4D0L1_9HELO